MQASLSPAALEIGVRRLRRDRDADPELLRFGRFGFGPCHLGTAAQAPEEIDFPTRPGTEVVERLVPVITWEMTAVRPERALQRLVQLCGLSRQIARRQEARAG